MVIFQVATYSYVTLPEVHVACEFAGNFAFARSLFAHRTWNTSVRPSCFRLGSTQ